MQYFVTTLPATTEKSDCIAIAVYENGQLSTQANQVNDSCDGHIKAIVEQGDFKAKPGQTLLLHAIKGIQSPRVLLVGMGKEASISEDEFTQSITAMITTLDSCGASSATCYLSEVNVKERSEQWKTRQIAIAAEAALYQYTATKNDVVANEKPIESLTFYTQSETNEIQQAAQTGQAIANGMNLAKTLGNLPGNICTPSYLAEQAIAMAERFDGLSTTVLDEAEMEELGMGSLLSVSRGSRQPAKLITMNYQCAGDSKPIVLVGKGLTFDAGGISLKPAAGMDEMKYDMCGSASVFGTLSAVAELKLPINIIGVIPSSENMPDGDANKPGDIVTSMAGKTIEVLNTDAEGRLILCDALTYSERFDPEVVIDIATLTGAIIVALGSKTTGLMANNQQLADDLLKAGQESHDKAWQLPLWDEYQEQLDSNFADIANIGGKEAGSVTAACFLSRFTEKFTWAHLDIAGTAWKSGGKDKGATGRPVPLLMQYILNRLAD